MENRILKDLYFDNGKGGLFFQGVRYLLIRPEVLVTFQKGIEKELAGKAERILFNSGFQGGMLSSKKFKEDFQLSDEETIRFMMEMGAQIGWGRFELAGFDPVNLRLSLKVYSSPFAEAYGKSEKSICHFIRGVMAGLAFTIFGKEIYAEETNCLAKGDPLCKFELMCNPSAMGGDQA